MDNEQLILFAEESAPRVVAQCSQCEKEIVVSEKRGDVTYSEYVGRDRECFKCSGKK